MQEARGNLWDFHAQGHWVGILTNGIVRKDGYATMGAGVAKQARDRFPTLSEKLGGAIKQHGNIPHAFPGNRVVSFPTKHDWRDPADLKLIERSARDLIQLMDDGKVRPPVYLPRPGVGLGGLDWYSQVKPLVEPILDDRVVIVTY